jgi:putative CocE/NonD family hydrolase
MIAWVMQFLAVPDAIKRGDREAAARLAAAAGNLDALFASQPLRDFAPLREAGVAQYFFDWLEHDTRDEYWKEISLEEHGRYDRIEVPCLHVVGWYDTFIEGTLTNFSELFARAGDDPARTQRLLVGPWLHIPWSRLNGARNFGPEADNPIDQIQLAWFDHWLKGDGASAPGGPTARIFVMGKNGWRDADAWPPPEAQIEEWYLRSSGRALSLSGDGELSREPPQEELPDVFAYLPVAPAPSRGGTSCCLPDAAPMGSFEQTIVEVRNDVLVYSTPPLQHEVEVTGTVELVLHAATDVIDTDWTAKLVDVWPDGRAWNLCDGIVRARFRESLEEPTLLEAGRIYEYRIRVGSTSNLFKRGHRIRLEISSSNFPMHDVNTNTGARVKDATLLDSVVATQVVYHDSARPSRLLLPVVPVPGAAGGQ